MDHNLLQMEDQHLAAEKKLWYGRREPSEKLLQWRVRCLATGKAGGAQVEKDFERKTKEIL